MARGIASGCAAGERGRHRRFSSKWHGHLARASYFNQTDARVGSPCHCSFIATAASALGLATMALGLQASAFGPFGGLGGFAHFGDALGLDEERAELGEALALVAFLRAQVVGLDDEFAGVGEIVRAERGEAVLGTGGDGQGSYFEAERALGGALVDVLAAGAGA